MKCRRGNKAEDTSEIICVGFGAEATGNFLLDSCAADRSWLEASLQFQRYCWYRECASPAQVILEVAEALQQTSEFTLGIAPTFSGSAFRNGVGGKSLVDQSVVAFKVYRYSCSGKASFPSD